MKKGKKIAGQVRTSRAGFKNLQKILEKEQDKHKEAMFIIDFVVKETSHEIRNFLTTIKSNAQFSLKYYSDSKELRESLKAIFLFVKKRGRPRLSNMSKYYRFTRG